MDSSFSLNAKAKTLLALLGEYRVLECTCCHQVFGFQDKQTGQITCVGGCHLDGAGVVEAGSSSAIIPSTSEKPEVSLQPELLKVEDASLKNVASSQSYPPSFPTPQKLGHEFAASPMFSSTYATTTGAALPPPQAFLLVPNVVPVYPPILPNVPETRYFYGGATMVQPKAPALPQFLMSGGPTLTGPTLPPFPSQISTSKPVPPLAPSTASMNTSMNVQNGNIHTFTRSSSCPAMNDVDRVNDGVTVSAMSQLAARLKDHIKQATKEFLASSSESSTASDITQPIAKFLWSAAMKYSPNLVAPNARVRVQFAWMPSVYTISAEADDKAMTNLTCKLQLYAKNAKPLQKAPAKNDMVISEYHREYYRARVTKVNGDRCDLIFIDYGDKKICHYSEVYPFTEKFTKLPVYGLIVQLRLPVSADHLELSDALLEHLYKNLYILDIKKGPTPVPGDEDFVPARLWDLDKYSTLNEHVVSMLVNVRQ